jgi:hypothetical protein
MPLTPQGPLPFKHVDQVDNPTPGTYTPTELKTQLDSTPEALKTTINNMITILEGTTTSDSGAHNIGSQTISGVSGATVYAQLVALKALFDGYVIDQIPDSSLTDVKLSNDAGQIKDVVTKELSKNNAQSTTLQRGLSVIETDQQTGVEGKADGRTLVNHMGWQGKFESLFNRWDANLAIDTAVYKFGTSSGKIDNSAGTGAKLSLNSQKEYLSGKYVLLGFWAKAVSGTPQIQSNLLAYDSAGTGISSEHMTITKTIDATWKFYYAKFDRTVATADHWKGRLHVDTYGTANDVVNFDGMIVNELTQAQYNEIDILTSDQVAEKYGYVDSVKHIQNPVFVSYGKNLSPTKIDGWEQGSILTADGANTSSTTRIRTINKHDVIPDTNYVISIANGYELYLVQYNDNTLVSTHYWHPSGFVFTTSANTNKVRIVIRKPDDSTIEADVILDVQPQLELGSTATTFTPHNPTYLYGKDVKLGAIGDKKDLLNVDSTVTKWIEKDVVLDGNLGWIFGVDFTGFKRVRTDKTFTEAVQNTDGTTHVVKYDGKIIPFVGASWDKSDEHQIDTYFAITIADTDSGWLEAMTPTASMIKGYFNGWKYTGDGTTHSWVSIVDGSASPTQTEAYVSANVASGFTPYSLSYQRANSVTESVTLEGDLTLIDGLNQVELSEGVVVRELVNPSLATSHYRIADNANVNGYLKYKNNGIVEIYKDGKTDKSNWIINTDSGAQGKQRGAIPEADFDTTAQYTVTYLVLDKHLFTANAESAEITYSTNLKTVVDKNVDKIAKITTKQSIQDIFNEDVAVKGEGEVVQRGNASATGTITFKRAYATAPTILLGAKGTTLPYATSVTTTGFTLNGAGAYWEAIGK